MVVFHVGVCVQGYFSMETAGNMGGQPDKANDAHVLPVKRGIGGVAFLSKWASPNWRGSRSITKDPSPLHRGRFGPLEGLGPQPF